MRGWSIRRKLVLLTTGISFFALVLSGVLTVTSEWFRFRDSMVRELSIQADIIGSNSVVTLSFESLTDDIGSSEFGSITADTLVADFDASETLNTLQANKHIISACIYSKSGSILSKYMRAGGEEHFPEVPGEQHNLFSDDHLVIVQPIVDSDGEAVGTVYLKSDLEALRTRIQEYTTIVGVVALACFLIVLLLSIWLQSKISAPILDLARTAEVVSVKRDYSLRAESRSRDEVGVLIDAFNDMLSTIQRRDSKLKELTEQLGDYNRILESKVEHRTTELAQAMKEAEEARDRAMEANLAKSQFLANMSHEIRTPMNAILGLTDLSLRSDLSQKVRDYLTKLRTSSISLLGIIHDILDFSRIEAGKLDLEEEDFELCSLVANLADLVSEEAARKGIELLISIGLDVPCALRGDPLRLGQVLTNLANNAVKFTETGNIVIEAELVEKDARAAKIKFSVKDTGIGIRPEVLPKLFDSFTQADGSNTRRYGGSGLGLTICRRLVELMGGEIRLQSKVGSGSTFSFILELERQPEEKEIQLKIVGTSGGSASKIEDEPNFRGRRILVVEDHLINQDIVREILVSSGLIAEIANNGLEAVRMVSESQYDAVLMDVQMPEMDGYEATRILRADPRFQKLPIIAITAHAMKGDREKCLAAGMDSYLTKPINREDLLSQLASVLEPVEVPKDTPSEDVISSVTEPGPSALGKNHDKRGSCENT